MLKQAHTVQKVKRPSTICMHFKHTLIDVIYETYGKYYQYIATSTRFCDNEYYIFSLICAVC